MLGDIAGTFLRGSVYKYIAIIAILGLGGYSTKLKIENYSLNSSLQECQEENRNLVAIITQLAEDLETANVSVKVLLRQCDDIKKYYDNKPSRPGGDIDNGRLEWLFGGESTKPNSTADPNSPKSDNPK